MGQCGPQTEERCCPAGCRRCGPCSSRGAAQQCSLALAGCRRCGPWSYHGTGQEYLEVAPHAASAQGAFPAEHDIDIWTGRAVGEEVLQAKHSPRVAPGSQAPLEAEGGYVPTGDITPGWAESAPPSPHGAEGQAHMANATCLRERAFWFKGPRPFEVPKLSVIWDHSAPVEQEILLRDSQGKLRPRKPSPEGCRMHLHDWSPPSMSPYLEAFVAPGRTYRGSGPWSVGVVPVEAACVRRPGGTPRSSPRSSSSGRSPHRDCAVGLSPRDSASHWSPRSSPRSLGPRTSLGVADFRSSSESSPRGMCSGDDPPDDYEVLEGLGPFDVGSRTPCSRRISPAPLDIDVRRARGKSPSLSLAVGPHIEGHHSNTQKKQKRQRRKGRGPG